MTITIPAWFIWPAIPVALLIFYVLYLAAINVISQWKRLHPVIQTVCAIPILVMLVIDFVFNFTVFTLVFLDPPLEWMVTSRLQRYRSDAWPRGLRKAVSTFVCEAGLNPFDLTAMHC